jgi:hypothetical protein
MNRPGFDRNGPARPGYGTLRQRSSAVTSSALSIVPILFAEAHRTAPPTPKGPGGLSAELDFVDCASVVEPGLGLA